MSISKLGQRGRRIGLILFGLGLGVITAEVGLRIIGYSFPEFYVTDTSRGYALRAGVSGWYRKENEVFIRINSDGLRDREHAKVKPPDTTRIALIGDSYAEALQVPLAATFWTILEQRLNACSLNHKQIEIINFGVSGYGTAQELITLREHVWQYSPDIVLLAFTTSNDVTDNFRALKKARDVPYFIYREGKLVVDESFQSTTEFQWRQSVTGRLGRWMRDHFRVVQATIEGHRALRLRLAAWRSSGNTVPSVDQASDNQSLARSTELGTDNFVYLAPTDDSWKQAWQVTEGLIETMATEVNTHNAKFIVVTMSNGIQVAPSIQTRNEFMQRFGVTDLFYPDHRIESLGIRGGFEVIALAPELLRYAEQNNTYLHGFGSDIGSGHWNENGHRVAGEFLSAKFCEEGLLK